MKMQKGFSLVELMIALAIIGILAAIAYPGYSSHMKKTRRNMAASCLQENAQYFERWYTSKLTYKGASAQACGQDIEPFYTVTESNVDDRTYTLSAEPKGAQAKDKCGTLKLNEKGQREFSEEGATGCW